MGGGYDTDRDPSDVPRRPHAASSCSTDTPSRTGRSSPCRRPSRRARGTVTNAVYGFTSMVIKLLAEEHPDLIAVAFDSGAPTVRLEKDAEYKAGRPRDPGRLHAAARPDRGGARGRCGSRCCGSPTATRPTTRSARSPWRRATQGIDATIVTADRDFFQLVRPGDHRDVQPQGHLRHRPLRRGRRDRAVRRSRPRSTSTSWP